MTESRSVRKFGKKDLIGYFMGDFGSNMTWSFVGGYLMTFYTQHVGLSLGDYSKVLLLVQIWSSASDAVVGHLIDKRDVGAGDKYLPVIKYMAPILCIQAPFMFFDYSNISYTGKLVACAVNYVLWATLYAIVNVPYGALASVITSDSNERAELSTARSFGANVGSTLIGLLVPFIGYKTMVVNGQEVNVFLGKRMFPIAIGLNILALIAFYLCSTLCVERVKPKKVEKSSEEASWLEVASDFFKNPALVAVSLAGFSQLLITSAARQLNQLTYQLYFRDGSLNAYQSIIQLLPIVLSMLIGPYFLKKWGTKETSANFMIPAIIVFFIMWKVPIENAGYWLFLQALALGFSFGVVVYIWGLLADAISYQEYLTGESNEATIYSIFSTLQKLFQGVTSAFIPWLIEKVAPTLDLTNPATWESIYSSRIKDLSIIFPLVGCVIAYISLKFINPLTRDKMSEIQKGG